jgi:hypothetical protein
MIYRFKFGYPGSKDDTMDSAVRISILCARKEATDQDKMLMMNYEKDGYGYRCPIGFGSAADNRDNLSRDNLIMLIWGLWKCGYTKAIRRLFWRHMFRGFFCQNIDRDFVGSRKRIIPHKWYKDSDPCTDTETIFNDVKLQPHLSTKDGLKPVTIEKSNFNFRDPLGPQHIYFFIKAAKMWWFYPVAWPLRFFHFLDLFVKREGEQNQIIAQCDVLGTLKVFKHNYPEWSKWSWKYWYERGETEYAKIMDEVVG